MDADEGPTSPVGARLCKCRVVRRSTFEHDLVMAAISLVADGRYPEVEVANLGTVGAIDGDMGALASAGGVAIIPLEADPKHVRGLAVRHR